MIDLLSDQLSQIVENCSNLRSAEYFLATVLEIQGKDEAYLHYTKFLESNEGNAEQILEKHPDHPGKSLYN